MAIDLGEDDGYVVVKAAGAEVTLDLWEVNDRLYDYYGKNKDRPDADYNAGLVVLMTTLGLPKVSYRMAAKFADAIREAVAEKKGKPSATAGSPASTASTPPA